jgi:hypothetical protein
MSTVIHSPGFIIYDTEFMLQDVQKLAFDMKTKILKFLNL